MCENGDEDVTKLKQIIEEKDRDLVCSAQYGKSLLDTNSHLEEEIEKLHHDIDKVTEEYEQYKHSTGLKLDVLVKSEQRSELQLADVKEFLNLQHKQEIEAITKKHNMETNGLKCKISEMQDGIDEKSLTIEQMSNKSDFLQNRISELECKAVYAAPPTPPTPKKLSDDLDELVAKNEQLTYNLKYLNQEFANYKESSILQNESSQKTIESLQMDKELFKQQSIENSEALKDCQDQLKDMKDELELLHLQTHNPESRGNSLFGEVEDRRVQAEKKFLSAKVKLQGMERKYKNQVNYSIQLKTQLIHLQHGRSESDREQICKLQSALNEARSDVRGLVDKVACLEGKLSQKYSSELDQIVKMAKPDNHVVELLQTVIKEKEKELSKYEEEFRKSRLDLIMETRRGDDAESSVFEAKRFNEQLRNKIGKLQLENTSLKLKYGEEVEGKPGIRVVRTEKLDQNVNDKSAPPTEQKDQENLPPEKQSAAPLPIKTAEKNNVQVKHEKPTNSSCLEGECPQECKQQ